jgi:hypothetical protein
VFLELGQLRLRLGILISVVVVLAAVAVGITAAVMLPRRNVDNNIRSEADQVRAMEWIDADDLVLRNELEQGTQPAWVPYRERREQWSDADVREHWIDPRAIGLEVLEAQVEQDIQRMLSEVP